MRVLQVFKPGMSNLNPGCPTFSNVRSPLSTPGAPRFQTWNLHCQRGVRRVFKRGISIVNAGCPAFSNAGGTSRLHLAHSDVRPRSERPGAPRLRNPASCGQRCGIHAADIRTWGAPRFQTRAECDSIVPAIQRRNNLAHSDVRPRSERPGAPRLRTRVGSVVVSTQPISARGVPRVFKRGRNVIQSSRLQSSVETTWRTPTYDPGRNDLGHPD
jgi:hypothetical protein